MGTLISAVLVFLGGIAIIVLAVIISHKRNSDSEREEKHKSSHLETLESQRIAMLSRMERMDSSRYYKSSDPPGIRHRELSEELKQIEDQIEWERSQETEWEQSQQIGWKERM